MWTHPLEIGDHLFAYTSQAPCCSHETFNQPWKPQHWSSLVFFSIYPFLVMLKDGEPVIVEWFPAKSTTISVVFFWFGFILPLNHVLLIPISPSSDRLPDCPEGPAVSRYGFFQRMDGLSTQMRRMDCLNTTEPGKTWWCSALWISSSGSIFTFHVTPLEESTSPYSIIFPPSEAPECFNLFPIQ